MLDTLAGLLAVPEDLRGPDILHEIKKKTTNMPYFQQLLDDRTQYEEAVHTKICQYLELLTFHKDDVIENIDQKPKGLYIIVSGSVSFYHHKNQQAITRQLDNIRRISQMLRDAPRKSNSMRYPVIVYQKK